MFFSPQPRTHYDRAPAHEVICQLRFPTILTINTTEPADFQERIRAAFPQYVRRQDALPPRISGLGTDKPQLLQQPPTANYHFLSADGKWKLNLTKDFIALSTLAYSGWEEFAHRLDQPLAAFIETYQPAHFQRVGLRYLNIFSRSALGLEDAQWAQLIAPAYTAALREPDVSEEHVLNCGTDLTLRLDSSCQAKIHAGPGRIKTADGTQDPEVKFIFDLDLSMSGQIPCKLAAAGLETIHGHGGRIFEGALTDRLRAALSGK